MAVQFANQRESFPKLDLIAAKAAIDRMSSAVCLFELHRKIVGQLFLPIVDDQSINVNYFFSARHIQSKNDEAVLKTKTVNTYLDRYRRFMFCPRCGKLFGSLYFKDEWACGDCLRLYYRRQLIDGDTALWEKRDELAARLQRGRPKGMHNATYSKLREQLSRFECDLSGKPRKYASDAHDLIIRARWVRGEDVDLWSPYYAVHNGEIARISQ